jgi:hypothetical protein
MNHMLVILKRSVFARFSGFLPKGAVTLYDEDRGAIMMNPKSTNPVWLSVDAKKTFIPMEWDKVK